ncbi:uncharacterized protein [Blastocystis hominis]|uniref:CCR4-NOT transcription complex subunit 4 n=1 Tax=Blastocystis hominis TaxID=12968 RepID=D8LYA2_BLAHO|nr:uncharacterized protein [Blastocystis hominis]CBK20557.2 unnamed protein product [Blastocystis hominis]|eukprot:XP_012894605.1 uncharacterized protein [Blastocystis hominis]
MIPQVCPMCFGVLKPIETKFKICPCGFQICHWCLGKILHEGNCCPECKRPYSKRVIHMVDNSSDSQNSEGCSYNSDRERHGRELSAEKIQYLQNIRIIQKNLVYIIGLAPSLANESLLRSYSFFGKYGKIKKIILNSNPELVEKVHSCCAYITFESSEEACRCILAVDGCILKGSQIRASFGTTKYCNFFLRGIQCTNSECMYLHYMAKEEDCFTKKEMQERQSEFYYRTHPNMSARSTPVVLKSLDSLPLPPDSPGSRQRRSHM